jgi:hypothetical protein
MRPLKFVFNKTACIFDGPAGVVRPSYYREYDNKEKIARLVREVSRETGLAGEDLAEELNRRYEVVREAGRFGIKPR